MTDIDDTDPPALTRAQRRQEQSRAGRRAARRAARTTTAEPTPETGDPAVPELEVEVEPVPEVEAEVEPVPDVQPEVEAEVEPVPDVPSEVQPEADPEVEPEPSIGGGLTRRERREQRQRSPRRGRATPAVGPGSDPTESAAPALEPIGVPVAAAAPPAVATEASVGTGATAPTPGARSLRRSPAPRNRPPARDRAPRERRVRGDRRFWTRVVPLIAASLALLVGLGAVLRAADDGNSPRRAAAVSRSGPRIKTLLLVHHSPLYGNDLMVLVGRQHNRGSVLLIPGATQLDVPSLGVATLSAVPVDDNGVRLANSVENVVGVGIGHTAVLDDAALTAVLGPAAPIPVTLTNPVEISVAGTKYDAGAQRVSAAQGAELMSGPQAVNELDRLVTASAVIDGWLTRLKDPNVARRTLALSSDLAAMVATAAAKQGYRMDTLPVDSIATGGGERFGVRTAELERYVIRAFPRDRLGGGRRRPRVEILNGTGFLGVAQAVAEAIVPAGGKVTLTENVRGFGVPTTQIVYYKDSWRAGAQRLLDAMGCGSLRKSSRDLGISDVTILVGLDCPRYGVPGGNN